MVKKSYLRNLSGREMLPSNYFSIKDDNRGVNIAGQGYGHGVGLCQLGALELAKRGYTYKQILSFYFPQHHLNKAY
jgi:stage II sporulation protein D